MPRMFFHSISFTLSGLNYDLFGNTIWFQKKCEKNNNLIELLNQRTMNLMHEAAHPPIVDLRTV